MSETRSYKLGEVTVNFDSRRVPVRAADRRAGEFPYYGASGVVDYVDGYLFDGEYLLIAEDGENLRTRKTPIAFMATGKFWVNNHAHIVRGNDLANTRYLCYALANTNISGFLSGSTQPKLTQAALNSVQLQLPSRKHQDAVIEVLGALDDKIAVNERISTTSRLLGDAIFASFIVRSLEGDLIATRLGDLAKRGHLQYGDGYRTKKSEHGSPGIPILRVAEILDGYIAPKPGDNVHERFRAAMGTKVSRPGDVVLTTKGTVGRVAVITRGEPEFVYSPQLCYFRPLDGTLSSPYLFYWFRSERFWSQARSLKGQTDMADYINLADISSLLLDVPVSDGSNLVLKELVSLEAAVEQAHREREALAVLRDRLLPGLMSGAIRVRDAEKAVEDA